MTLLPEILPSYWVSPSFSHIAVSYTHLFGAVAAGRENGGFSHILEAAERLGKRGNTVYDPIPEHTAVYDRLYGEYKQLHDYFGRGGSNVMKRLKALSREQKQKEQNFQP